MRKFFENVQPAIKTETKKVAIGTIICLVIMWAVFLGLHLVIPEKVPFDYTVILGGIGGSFVAVLNFFMMGLTVQKVVDTADEDAAKLKMKASYSKRMMMQMLWGILAIVLPCFHLVAGVAPLLFPSIAIKVQGIIKK